MCRRARILFYCKLPRIGIYSILLTPQMMSEPFRIWFTHVRNNLFTGTGKTLHCMPDSAYRHWAHEAEVQKVDSLPSVQGEIRKHPSWQISTYIFRLPLIIIKFKNLKVLQSRSAIAQEPQKHWARMTGMQIEFNCCKPGKQKKRRVRIFCQDFIWNTSQ